MPRQMMLSSPLDRLLSLQPRCRSVLGVACGALGAVVAVAVLVGWMVGSRTLVQVGPGFAPMQINTAICFLVSFVALLVLSLCRAVPLRRPAVWIAGTSATMIIVIGGLTLVQYWLGVDFGIDELFGSAYVTTRTSHPGRMSPWTAVGFVGVGAVLASSLATPAHRALTGLASAIDAGLGALATTMLVLYVLEVDPTLGAASSTRMAVHTAALFWLLAAGLGAVLAMGSPGARRAFRAVPILIGLIVTLTVRQGLVDRDHVVINRATQEWVDDLSAGTAQLMATRFEALDRMAARAASGAYASLDIWRDDARRYSLQVLDGEPIGWLDTDLAPRWIEPDWPEAYRRMADWVADPQVGTTATTAASFGRPTASPPLVLADGQAGTIVVTPILRDGLLGGYIVGAIRFTEIFDRGTMRGDYNLEVAHDTGPVYAMTPDGAATRPPASVQTAPLNFTGSRLTAAAWPSSRTLAATRSRLPVVVLLAGLVMTGLIASLTATAHAQRRSELRFRSLLESAPDAMVIMDRHERMVLVNSRTEQLFGYARQQLVGQPIASLSPERLRDRYTGTTEGWPMNRSVELTGRRSDGSEMPVEVTLSPIQTDEGRLVAAAIRDVTERREMISQLQRNDRLKSEFVSTVSHEMRTPLTIIREFATLVEDGTAGPVNPDQVEHLRTVVRNCDRLTGLIGDLLELARLESGKYRLDREPVAVEALLRQCVKDFEPLVATKQQRISLEWTADVPDVLCDRQRVTQVLVNLVGNAHKFTPEGGRITLRARALNNWVEIEVEDTGIGIAPDEQAHIFGAFVQVGRRDGPGSKGTGLGLNVARQIVELHGGTLRVSSRPAAGSTFRFTLPAHDRGQFEAFIAPHVRRRQAADEVLSLVLVRSRGANAALEAASTTAASLRRVGHDEAMLDRRAGLLAVVVEANEHGARQFMLRVFAEVGAPSRDLDYAIAPIPADGIDVTRVFHRDAAIGWRALT